MKFPQHNLLLQQASLTISKVASRMVFSMSIKSPSVSVVIPLSVLDVLSFFHGFDLPCCTRHSKGEAMPAAGGTSVAFLASRFWLVLVGADAAPLVGG